MEPEEIIIEEEDQEEIYQAEERRERAQSLVVFAILIFVLLAMVALILDGAMDYYMRRVAQNAADAGALAGARVFCEDTESLANRTKALETAEDYIEYNNALPRPGYPNITAGGKVQAATTITFDTFLARLLGRETLTTNAYAEAGCFAPCLGEGVLPVVWICKPEAEGGPPGRPACEDLPIDQETINKYISTPETTNGCVPQYAVKGNKIIGYSCPELTLVMDNLDIDYLQCQSQGGAIDCDFDGDGDDDYVSSDNRGWADLDGNVSASYSCPPTSEGASELTDWILNGYSCPFEIHTWVGDQSGAASNIYKTVEERRVKNPIVVLPVFDDSCPGDPESTCPTKWHDGTGKHPPDDLTHVFTSAPNYYHIIRFAAFYITCIQENQHNDPCPGAMAFYHQNETYFKGGGFDDPITGNKYQAIEGYFLKGYIPGLQGACGDDISTGVFTTYLDK
jgi:predicted nucleic acid-binding Zn ribbon protein